MSRNDDERAAGRAECFARLVLAGQQDAHGRSLLDHAERLTERLAMYWEKEVDVAFEALRLAAAVVAETSMGTLAPATPEDRQALKAARDARQTGLQAIRATASVIERIATRILASPTPEGDDDGAIH